MIAAYRAQKNPGKRAKLMFVPGARLWHYPRQSVPRFWRQMWTYGATRIRLIRAGTDFHPASIAPALLVLALLALGIAAFFHPYALQALLGILALYFLFCLVVTLGTCCRLCRPYALLLLLFIPLMHIAYGLAEWTELFRPNRDFSERPPA